MYVGSYRGEVERVLDWGLRFAHVGMTLARSGLYGVYTWQGFTLAPVRRGCSIAQMLKLKQLFIPLRPTGKSISNTAMDSVFEYNTSDPLYSTLQVSDKLLATGSEGGEVKVSDILPPLLIQYPV